MIAFKEIETVDQWPRMHARLREILLFLANAWPAEYLVITRLSDTARSEDLRTLGQSGIHGCDVVPIRAADIRTKDLDESVGQALANKVNTRWIYDPARTNIGCALQHATPIRHLHIQVHPSTKPRLVGVMT